MIYESAQDWLDAPRKRVMVFGMSGLGKTHVSNMLRASGDWFHYSIDYRIGTRYMGELIADNAKREAMKVPFLADLLKSDSIYIGSNITFDNLAWLSTYLGKPGDPHKGGLPIEDWRKRQDQHTQAEIAALMDTPAFMERAKAIYDYPHFICDSGGSICEVVDPFAQNDPVLDTLEANLLMVWIEGTEAHTEELMRRFAKAPKPMCYQGDFLMDAWRRYLEKTGDAPDRVDPDAFVKWVFGQALEHRRPRYAAMARRGVTVAADDIGRLKSPEDFAGLVADAITNRSLEMRG